MALPYTVTLDVEVFSEGTRRDMPSRLEASDIQGALASALARALSGGEGYNYKIVVKHEDGYDINIIDEGASSEAFQRLEDTQLSTLAIEAGRPLRQHSVSMGTLRDLVGLGFMAEEPGPPGRFIVTDLGQEALDAYGVKCKTCRICKQEIVLEGQHWIDRQDCVCFDQNPHEPKED